MNDKKYIRELYRRSLEDKWDAPIEDIDVYHYCPFCFDKMDKAKGHCSTSGSACEDVCLIDKSICGSEDSLMSKLEDVYIECEAMSPEGIDIINKIKKRMKKHAKRKILRNK